MGMSYKVLFRISAIVMCFCFMFMIFLGTNKLCAQPPFDNSSFSGLWIGYDPAQQERDTIYMLSDGDGMVLDCNTFHFVSQDSFYSVQNDGAITIGLFGEHDGLMQFEGFLLSSTEGTFEFESAEGIMNFNLKKVLDKSVLQGTWFGTFDSRNVNFTVDANGEISSLSGFENPVSGRIYEQSGFVAGFIESSEEGDFYLVKINGTFDGEKYINGSFGSDNRGPELTDLFLERREPSLPGVKMLLLED